MSEPSNVLGPLRVARAAFGEYAPVVLVDMAVALWHRAGGGQRLLEKVIQVLVDGDEERDVTTGNADVKRWSASMWV
ncbi:hypothetical protein BC936DRAFT_137645 [Jimgerdemannia flammicorona]|uniref:Uncharacterized protein n=1 Tax=Jimgerdemannia flammicorona TaxID=994334 RepID=A0A433DJ31_9FUNG|nr:hypothetical protein BC936DRAFT_137645 [Jimgerdemannia flammicorona]